ncbi:hypothetical protein MOE04_07210 [Bacillus atrophaeus]|nr:hypothetical protein [Bacillus atrophaeus]
MLAGLYDISWFVGVLISFLSYITLMRLHPPYPAAVPVPYAVNVDK